jgi:hypothetical protein
MTLRAELSKASGSSQMIDVPDDKAALMAAWYTNEMTARIHYGVLKKFVFALTHSGNHFQKRTTSQ